jgi:hypothetical protein
MRIKITALDSLFSLAVRMRDRWTCQRCKRQYAPPTSSLHCAHMFTRRNKSTRFDLMNACALCYGCHQYIDSHPHEKIEFFTKKIGEKNMEYLRLRSNQPGKIDSKLISIGLKEYLKILENETGDFKISSGQPLSKFSRLS